MVSQASHGDRPLDADTILDLLANRRRRYLLYALRDRTEPVELAQIADQIASWELDRPANEVPQNDYKSVYVSSVQCHVPKLADEAVIHHDAETHSVVLDRNFTALEPYLELSLLDEPDQSLVAEAFGAHRNGLLGQLRSTVLGRS